MRRQIQQKRLLKLIVDLGVFKSLVHMATKKDILPLLAVGKHSIVLLRLILKILSSTEEVYVSWWCFHGISKF